MQLGPTYHRLRYFFSDAWDELCHSPGVNVLAVATLTSVLFMAGLVMVLLSNLEAQVERMREDVRVEVYLEDDIAPDDLERLRRELETGDGVIRVDYVSKDQALERFQEFAADMAALIEELDTNPLPASFEVLLASGPGSEARFEQIAAALGDRSGVESARFDRKLLLRLEALLDLARLGGTALAFLVFAAAVFVMAGVLRLAVYARQDEIDIMLLVGATPAFVRGPFLVAGLGQGLIASLLALAVVEGARRFALAQAESSSMVLLELVAANPLPWHFCLLVVVIGLFVSFSGSYFAVRRSFLRGQT